jgi:hypothetical protein
MPRTCTVCTHPDRGAIDAALVAGEPYRSIARRCGVSAPATYRHQQEHIPVALSKAKEAAVVAHADGLLEQVRDLQGKALGILGKAEAAGDLRVALGAIREARGNLELLAKLMGELSDAPQVNVMVSPEWISVRTVIVAALAPFPDARAAVAERLLALEGRP